MQKEVKIGISNYPLNAPKNQVGFKPIACLLAIPRNCRHGIRDEQAVMLPPYPYSHVGPAVTVKVSESDSHKLEEGEGKTDRGNESELPINFVIFERLKWLISLDQNGKWVAMVLSLHHSNRPYSHRRIGRP